MSLPALPEPLPSPVVDSHCHLDVVRDGEPGLPVAEALELAASVGVTRVVQVGCDLAGSRWAVEAATVHDRVVAAVALHPNEAPKLAARGELDVALAGIGRLAESDEVRAVGETGLDYFRTGPEGRDAQHASFRGHLALARRLDRTVVIHDRDAHDDVLAVIDDAGAPSRWVMHCFSGDAAFARECVERGAHLSFAGTVSFKNAEPLREALRVTPRERVLVETDAPFLTPAPYRGRTNASYLVPLTMRVMAEVLDADLAGLCRSVEQNTFDAFGGPWG